MKVHPGLIASFCGLALMAVCCEPFEKVSDVPEVKFKSFTLYELDTLDMKIKVGELVFNFVDGNADFGIDESSEPEDTVNLFMIAYQKTGLEYDSLSMDTYGRKYTVLNDENMVRTGQNKTIKGEIKVDVYYFLTPPFDTIRYAFYIKDRAGNLSNIDFSTDIGF
jgi:hypothetical protein